MKKRGLLILIALGIVIAGVMAGRFLWRPAPGELAEVSLERLNGAASFRFSITQHQWVDGKDRLLTQIQGEKDGGNTRIQGQLVGGEVEMIHMGDSLYIKDPLNKKWSRFTSTPAAQEVFLAELNPLSSLQFKELGEVVLSGQEKINGEKLWVLNLKPSVQNQIMEEFWKDFAYTLYVRKSDQSLVKVQLQAKSKTKDEPMSITMEFRDIGKKISIPAPSI